MAKKEKRVPTNREWAKAIARAWADEDFRELLETHPIAAFMKLGIEIDTVLRIPARPDNMSDEHIESIDRGEPCAAFTSLSQAPFTSLATDAAFTSMSSGDKDVM